MDIKRAMNRDIAMERLFPPAKKRLAINAAKPSVPAIAPGRKNSKKMRTIPVTKRVKDL